MVRARWLRLGVIGATLAAVACAAAGAEQGEEAAAAQPFVFPHDVHAGTYQIPCMYCHYSADRSPSAGIPPLQTCVGCHAPGGVPMIAADRPDVAELLAYWGRGEPIPWNREHRVPDHVRFPHHMHVAAGLECQACHGPVEEMREVRQVESLRMGWCIDCHRQLDARTDCFVCHY